MKSSRAEQKDEDSIEVAIDNSVFLCIIEFGLKHPDGFTHSNITSALKLADWERTTTERYLDNAYRNTCNSGIPSQSTSLETPFFATKVNKLQGYQSVENTYIVSFDAHFKYLDYQELKFARQNAKEAKKLAIVAIIISALATLASIVVPILVAEWLNQTVRLDDVQFQAIQQLERLVQAPLVPVGKMLK